MPRCAACGHENLQNAKFCSQCGAALTAAAPAREERKVVTVLFCDLVGSTARAEGSDPEDVRAVLSAYHERVRSELERFGGTVEKFIGDAVMALFGAPTTHEDDPERAVRAALAIRDWAQEEGDLQVRIGITTGEALVSLSANPQAGEGVASGDVVNTAARLENAAPTNAVLVDETTFRATGHVIDYGEAEEVAAKGKADPVRAWQPVVARSRPGVDVRQHGAAPLVGREREVELLVGTFDRVRADRAPQLLTLVGAPGIGKSRLVYELMERLESGSELVTWHQGRSLPYGEGVSFWALGEVVKAQAGILESDVSEQAAEKLRRAVADAIVDVKDAEWVERHLRALVGLAAEQELTGDRHEEAFAAWRRFLEALAERRPLVLVFEDLHWADEGLLDFVDHVVEWATGVPVLVLCTARPELLDRRPGWGGGKLNASTQALSPLGEGETARLIGAVLEQTLLPAETQEALLERAGGNPLYAEQFARLYAERGTAEDLPLPETVQGIVAARLDTLPSDEKELLQNASVFGKVFWTAALGGEAEALRRVLHSLERKGFVRRERSSSVEGEDEYSFSHLLVREVSYGQIPRAPRAEKHRLAAAWIESLGASEGRAELLAHHYSAALELARAAGRPTDELGERARLALREAGDRASALNSHASAARYYAAALELWPPDDAERARLQLRHGRALLIAEERGGDVLTQARDALLAASDLEGAAEAEAALGELAWIRGNQQERALAHLEQAVVLAGDIPASPGKAYVFTTLSRLQAFAGQEAEAIEAGREALALADEFGLDEIRAHALDNIGIARVLADDLGGIEDLERSLEIALRVNSPEAVRASWNLFQAVDKAGDLRRSSELIELGLRQAERFGSPGFLKLFRNGRVEEHFNRGEWDRAFELTNEFGEGGVWIVRPLIRLARGDAAGALNDASAILADVRRRPKDRDSICPTLGFYAWVLSETGRDDDAAALVDECVSLALGEGRPYALSQSESVFVLTALGRERDLLATLEGASETPWVAAARLCALGDFEQAADIYAGLGSLPTAAYARLRTAQQLVAQGRQTEADVQLQQSLAFWRSVGAARYIREGEALLAESA